MGVSHRRIKEWWEFRVNTPSSKLLSPQRCKEQATHQPFWGWDWEEGPQTKVRDKVPPGPFSHHLLSNSPATGSGLSQFSLTRSHELSGFCPWALMSIIDRSKDCGWEQGVEPTLDFGVLPMGTQLIHKPQTQLNPWLSKDWRRFCHSWFMQSLSPKVEKTLKVILCLSTFCDRRFTTSWGRPLHLGERWQLEGSSLHWAQIELFSSLSGPHSNQSTSRARERPHCTPGADNKREHYLQRMENQ